ncbi:exonuclease domain-containing protein [Streptomyces sp. NBC_01373]|uniref:exonuclease domain-containing protein n=1 Tax=Streptomyces sp. NBC_01373 TaxID=2903843 RepID=UPI00224EF52B|nr:exonuclease domain-containing protein [Streptomyces sp. NBC_01373]MCX4703922.1 exonuclease domain-containing protein [Streptomyces sp. NBC_01373]
MSWHLEHMAALDFESSDKDAETARIVTCALILGGVGRTPDVRTWLLNPGIPMEPGAIAVHKITDEYAAKHGMPAEQGVGEIAKAISEVVAAGTPLVGHNIGGYDLNLLDRECRRHLGDSLEGICRQPLTRVIDTMVLDRQVAPFRKRISEDQGPYQMRTTAETYGLDWDEDKAHGAEYDAFMSARAAYQIGVIAHTPYRDRPEWVLGLRPNRFNSVRDLSVEELHARQIDWYREDAVRYQAYLRDKAKAKDKYDPDAVIDGTWPLRPAETGGAR